MGVVAMQKERDLEGAHQAKLGECAERSTTIYTYWRYMASGSRPVHRALEAF